MNSPREVRTEQFTSVERLPALGEKQGRRTGGACRCVLGGGGACALRAGASWARERLRAAGPVRPAGPVHPAQWRLAAARVRCAFPSSRR